MDTHAKPQPHPSLRFYVVEEYDEPGLPAIQIVGEYLGYPDAEGNVWLPFLGEDAVSREELVSTPAGRSALARWQRSDDHAYVMSHRLRAERDPSADDRSIAAISRVALRGNSSDLYPRPA